jgi:cation-transporting ATPase E
MIAACGLLAFLTIFWLPYQVPGWVAAWPFLARLDPQLDPSNAALMSTGLWAGVVAAVLVEAIWWFSGRFTSQHRSLWKPVEQRDYLVGLPSSVRTR